ncbi:MAG: hypothetical protein NTV95_01425 [Candidatus Saccharibacteria bacterium]|nr:hypothetical protein [Candidatus Saccharibacteria bacterium]
MSKSKNKSPMYVVILLVIVATGIVTIVSSFAATPTEGFNVDKQSTQSSNPLTQQAVKLIQNN